MKNLLLALMLLPVVCRGATVSYNASTGQLLQPTNFFALHIQAGTNLVATWDSTNYTLRLDAVGGSGGGIQFLVDGLPYTNSSINILESSTIDPSVSLGTNLAFGIKNYSVTLPMLATINPESLMGFGQGSGPDEIRRISLGPNLFFTNDVLDALIPAGSNQWQIGVNGSVVTSANLTNGASITVSAAGSNVVFAVANSGVSSGSYTNPTLTVGSDGRITSITSGSSGSSFDFSALTNAIVAGTGITIDYTSTNLTINSTAGGGDVFQAGSNVFTGTNVFQGPVDFNDVTISNLVVENLQLPFTNAIIFSDGSSNMAAVTIGANLTFSGGTLSATGGGGGTNGTAVTVDGGSDLTRANFADSSEVTFTLSGTNVTAGIPNDSIALGTKTTGNFVAGVVGTANEVAVSGGSGSEASTATLSLPATIDLGGKTSLEIPNGASPTTDAFGEIAGDNDAWGSGRGAVQFFDGTANTLLVGVLASDTPVNGQVPVWNTGGTITWEDQTGGGGGGSTSNVVQRTGFAEFTVTPSYEITNLVVSGVITNVSMTGGNGSLRGYFAANLSPARSGTNYSVVIEIEAEDPTALGSPVGNVVFDTKTTTSFDFVSRFTGAEAVPAGTKYLVSVLEPVTVGASTNSGGGDTQTWKYLTVDQATTSTTPQNITNLVFSIGANEVWTAEWYLGTTISGPTGMGMALDVPTGATLGATVRGSAANATVITADSTLSAAVMTSATGAIWGTALIQNGTNAGSVQLQFGSITNTVTSTIKGNQSYMVARKISP